MWGSLFLCCIHRPRLPRRHLYQPKSPLDKESPKVPHILGQLMPLCPKHAPPKKKSDVFGLFKIWVKLTKSGHDAEVNPILMSLVYLLAKFK